MYSNKEASAIRQKFWLSFGMYMLPIPSATQEKVNWVNYKTGIKGITFKMEADKESAIVVVEIFLNDTMLQHQYFKIFNNFVIQFESFVGDGWQFNCDNFNSHKEDVSRIGIRLKNVNIFREENWPEMITFLKQHMISLDAFWAEYKPAFELFN